VYALALRAIDSQLSNTDTVIVTVNPTPIPNTPPVVSAGPDQTIILPAKAVLSGTATDDGLPNPPGHLTYHWSKLSGPRDVIFADSSSAMTTATFSQPNQYVLILKVS
jgi:hypothetical protein